MVISLAHIIPLGIKAGLKNTKLLEHASKKVGMELNAERSKYIFLSYHKNTDKIIIQRQLLISRKCSKVQTFENNTNKSKLRLNESVDGVPVLKTAVDTEPRFRIRYCLYHQGDQALMDKDLLITNYVLNQGMAHFTCLR
jgi:hypothetical protein